MHIMSSNNIDWIRTIKIAHNEEIYRICSWIKCLFKKHYTGSAVQLNWTSRSSKFDLLDQLSWSTRSIKRIGKVDLKYT